MKVMSGSSMLSVTFAGILTDAMPDDVFFYYHLPLIGAITYWYTMPSTTMVGMLFFSAPYIFTLWGGLTVYAKGKLPGAML